MTSLETAKIIYGMYESNSQVCLSRCGSLNNRNEIVEVMKKDIAITNALNALGCKMIDGKIEIIIIPKLPNLKPNHRLSK